MMFVERKAVGHSGDIVGRDPCSMRFVRPRSELAALLGSAGIAAQRQALSFSM